MTSETVNAWNAIEAIKQETISLVSNVTFDQVYMEAVATDMFNSVKSIAYALDNLRSIIDRQDEEILSLTGEKNELKMKLETIEKEINK